MNIRRLGIAILKAALRRPAPGLQQWGEAMLNEMAAIENDWAAFRWALGSAAVLYRGCKAPINDASEIPRRLEHLQGITRRRQRAGYLVCFFVMGGFLYYLTIFPGMAARTGCALTVLGAGFLAVQLYLNRVRRQAAASGSTLSTASDQYRAVLQHMRDFHRGAWFWSRMIVFLPGPLLFMYALHRAHPDPGSLVVVVAFLAFGVIAIPLNLGLSRKFQREIERLDEVEKRP